MREKFQLRTKYVVREFFRRNNLKISNFEGDYTWTDLRHLAIYFYLHFIVFCLFGKLESFRPVGHATRNGGGDKYRGAETSFGTAGCVSEFAWNFLTLWIFYVAFLFVFFKYNTTTTCWSHFLMWKQRFGNLPIVIVVSILRRRTVLRQRKQLKKGSFKEEFSAFLINRVPQ